MGVKTKKDIYEIMTEQILNRMKAAEENKEHFRWIKPWTGGPRFPVSYTTGKTYRGVNFVTLDSGEYITPKALAEYIAKLPPEEAAKVIIPNKITAHPVFYSGKQAVKDKFGKEVKEKLPDGTEVVKETWFTRYYLAYKRDDIEGLPSHFPAVHYDHTPMENEERLNEYVAAYLKSADIELHVVKDGAEAFYRHDRTIYVPDEVGFASKYDYYHTLLHEITHSTGPLCKRAMGGYMGSEKYSQEELVAEIGSSLLLNVFGIVPDEKAAKENDIAYLNSWCKYLKDNKKALHYAASQAQKALKEFITRAEKELDIKTSILEEEIVEKDEPETEIVER